MSVVSDTISLENMNNNNNNSLTGPRGSGENASHGNNNNMDNLSPEGVVGEFLPGEMNPKCNLIVNYLPHDIDDNGLRALFEEFGEVINAKVVRDKNTKKSLGYGFVRYAEEYGAMMAIERMNGYNVGNKMLKVSIARPPSLDIRNCKLYVTNLPKEYTENEIVGLFKDFGEIIECRLLKEPGTNMSKGVAFVQFNLKQQANDALSMNGCQLEGSPRPLAVKYAEDQHKRKELNRLHSLTMNNTSYGRGGMMGGGPGGGGGGYGGGGPMHHMQGPPHHHMGPPNNMGMGMGPPPPHHHHQSPHHPPQNHMMGGGGPGGPPMNFGMNNPPRMMGPPPGGGAGGGGFRDQKLNNDTGSLGGGSAGGNGAGGGGGGGGPLGSPYFYQSPQSLTNMYHNPQPSPPPLPMVHSPIGNQRMMFGPPPNNPGTPPGMGGGGGGGGEFTGRRTPRAPKNGKSFGFENPQGGGGAGGPPPGMPGGPLQPGGMGNWFPPQQMPFMPPPNGGLPPPPALHPNNSNMAALSPRFYPLRSPQHQEGGPHMLGQLFPGGPPGQGPPPNMPSMQPNLQAAGLAPPGMGGPLGGGGMGNLPPPGMGPRGGPMPLGAMNAPPGMGGGPSPLTMGGMPGGMPQGLPQGLPPGMIPIGSAPQLGGGDPHDPYDKMKQQQQQQRTLYN